MELCTPLVLDLKLHCGLTERLARGRVDSEHTTCRLYMSSVSPANWVRVLISETSILRKHNSIARGGRFFKMLGWVFFLRKCVKFNFVAGPKENFSDCVSVDAFLYRTVAWVTRWRRWRIQCEYVWEQMRASVLVPCFSCVYAGVCLWRHKPITHRREHKVSNFVAPASRCSQLQ